MRLICAFATILCVATIALVGCGQPRSKPVNPMIVTTEDGSTFPASLAGQWKSDRHGWEFVIEPDGSISSAVISLGRVRVFPGRATRVLTKAGEDAVFKPGPWVVHYDPTAQMLTIKIAMEHVRVPMAANTLEGSSTDVFTGIVLPGTETWQAQWTAFTHYTGRMGKDKSVDLSTDKTYGETQSLLFVKTTDR